MKRVILIAYHYPPVWGSSGVQRTLSFSRHLLEYGWEPLVLTVHPRAHPHVNTSLLRDIPQEIQVRYAFGLDTARHLSIGGRYPIWLAWPDRWVSWWIGAVPAGLMLIKRFKPQLIWSTYPIATAHLIGLSLNRLTRLPWVADFRDSMTEHNYPPHPKTRRIYRRIEHHTVSRASRVVFTTPGTVDMYKGRYPEQPDSHWECIRNGYDEVAFQAAETMAESAARENGRLTLVHSGVLYPSERDPRAFFAALAELHDSGAISAENINVVLRATSHDEIFAPMIKDHGITDIVTLADGVSYKDALSEMLNADGLLIFQASNCNHQIPAKVYEYLRAGRPILALTDPQGDTAHVIREFGIDTLVRLDDKDDIKQGFLRFLELLRSGEAPCAGRDKVLRYSRRRQTGQLADLFDDVIAERHPT